MNKHAILNCDDFKGFLGIGDESHTDFRRVINVVPTLPTLPNVPRIDKVCGSLMIQLLKMLLCVILDLSITTLPCRMLIFL